MGPVAGRRRPNVVRSRSDSCMGRKRSGEMFERTSSKKFDLHRTTNGSLTSGAAVSIIEVQFLDAPPSFYSSTDRVPPLGAEM